MWWKVGSSRITLAGVRPLRCITAEVAVLVDESGRVTEIQGADGEERLCLAHRLVELTIPPPGTDVRCSLR